MTLASFCQKGSVMVESSVLFVCLGNICRSPTAEGIFRKLAGEAGLADRILIDSAGTAGWHTGKGPDPRSCATARRHGVDISGLRARQIRVQDFERFRFIVALDRSNLQDILRIAPARHDATVKLLLDFVPGMEGQPVPDPYYGDDSDFEETFRLARLGCEALLDAVRKDMMIATA